VEAARERGEIDTDVDPAQLAYELYAFMELANFHFVLLRDPDVLARGHRAIARAIDVARIGAGGTSHSLHPPAAVQRNPPLVGWCFVWSVSARANPAAGETATFEVFYRAEYPGLVRAMFLLSPDAHEAQELAQEAMVRVYERWDRVAEMESPRGYVYRVATNLHRRRSRFLAMRARRLRTLGARMHDVDPDIGRQELAQAIGSLSVPLREAFMLVEWLGMSSEEAARILHIAPASVRSRVHRARRGLRERLDIEETDDA
jgi:RNA polymerase sigma factor (sigma-70 family)